MAALPYMQLYPADYLADTMHLTAEEHGAYLLLLMNYWQTGKPIPKTRLQVIARVSNDRWPAVEVSLNEFFNDDGTAWHHKRMDADLKMAKDAQKQRSAAGKASAEARKNAKREASKPLKINDNSTGVATVVEIPLNENSTNKEQNRTEQNRTERKSAPATRGSRLPTDWQPTPEERRWAEDERPDLSVNTEIEKFRDYWHAKTGQAATKRDWSATWRNWIRNAYGSGKPDAADPTARPRLKEL